MTGFMLYQIIQHGLLDQMLIKTTLHFLELGTSCTKPFPLALPQGYCSKLQTLLCVLLKGVGGPVFGVTNLAV
jgi:hypothetical protein